MRNCQCLWGRRSQIWVLVRSCSTLATGCMDSTPPPHPPNPTKKKKKKKKERKKNEEKDVSCHTGFNFKQAHGWINPLHAKWRVLLVSSPLQEDLTDGLKPTRNVHFLELCLPRACVSNQKWSRKNGMWGLLLMRVPSPWLLYDVVGQE